MSASPFLVEHPKGEQRVVHDGAQLVHDNEGSELESEEAAVRAAARSAAEIGQSRLAKRDFSDVIIKVRDVRAQHIFTVTASMRVEWPAESIDR